MEERESGLPRVPEQPDHLLPVAGPLAPLWAGRARAARQAAAADAQPGLAGDRAGDLGLPQRLAYPRPAAHCPAAGRAQLGGILVSPWGVYQTLRRRGLHQRPARLRRFERLPARATGILTEYTRQLVDVRAAQAEVEADHPGALVGVDTFFVGKLKGVGKIWQYTGTDVASSYTFCWLTTAHDAKQAAHFAELLVTHYRDQRVALQRMLTDNGPEYVGQDFRDRLAELGITHTRITPRRPATNGHVERFHGTVLHEFYRLAFRRRYYRRLAELQADLTGFLGWYNYRRTHSGKRLRGSTPAAVFTHPANRSRDAA